MAGQAIVTINGKQWLCSVANTVIEITQGLSGVSSIPPGTGMLFDLGLDYREIQIDMTRMLFPLDIIFVNSTQGVVGVLYNVQPGEDATFQNESLPGARFFLEVNAGEASGVIVGDDVNIQGYLAPQAFNPVELFLFMLPYVIIIFMVAKIGEIAFGEPRTSSLILPQTESRGEEYVEIIAPGQTTLTIGSIVKMKELEKENKKARERGETPATARVWRGGKPQMVQPKLIPTKPPSSESSTELEFLADSPEFLTYTIDDIGYREKIDNVFKEAIARAKRSET